MFEKLKQIAQLKGLQDKIKRETVTVEVNGAKITMDGSFDVLNITLNPALDIKAQESAVKSCLSEAKSKLQSVMAKSLSGLL